MFDILAQSDPLGNWKLRIAPWLYILICLLLIVGIRLLQCLLKAIAMGHHEHDERDKDGRPLSGQPSTWTPLRRFIVAFNGFKNAKIADYWLGTVIGFLEIAGYPILMATGNLAIIGAWLGIKTAGAWGLWSARPTAYNRFLVLSLVNLVISYFWLRDYIVVCK